MEIETVHRVCELLHKHRRDPDTGRFNPCLKCPESIDTPYGRGTQGCVLEAKELIQLVRSALSAGDEPK